METTAKSSIEERSFEQSVQRFIRAHGRGTVSQCHFINLDPLAQLFGDEWQRLREKALNLAEGVINQHISKTEFCIRLDDHGFMVLLGDRNPEDGHRRSMLIAEAIRARIVGQQTHLGDMLLKVSSAGLEPDAFQDGDPVLAKLSAMLENAPYDSVTGGPSRGTGEDTEHSTDAKSAPIEKIVEQIHFHYIPIWNAQSHRIIGHRSLARRWTPYGVFDGLRVLHGGDEDPCAPYVVVRRLEQAFTLSGSGPAQTSLPLLIPIPYRVVADRMFESATEPWPDLRNLIGKAKASKGILFEILGLPYSVPLEQLQRVIHRLGGDGGTVFGAASHQSPTAETFLSVGGRVLSLHLDNQEHIDNGKLIADFGANARRWRLTSFICNVQRVDDFRTALTHKVTLLAGPTILPYAEKPVPSQRIKPESIVGSNSDDR